MTLWGNRASLQAGILNNGDAITTGNSANGGDAFTGIGTATGGTVTWDSATQTYSCSDTAGGGYARLEWNGVWNTDIGVAEVSGYGVSDLGGGTSRIIDIRSASASVCRIEVDNAVGAPKILVYDSTGTTLGHSGTTYLPTNAGWRISLGFEISTGTVQARLYLGGDGQSNTADWTLNLTGQNLGAANSILLYVGQLNSTPSGTHKIRYARFDNTTYAAMGNWASNPPVIGTAVATVGRNYTGQITAGTSPYTLSASQISGTSIGTITISGLAAYFAAPTVDTAVIRFTITDSNSQTDTEDISFLPGASAGVETYVWSDALQQWT